MIFLDTSFLFALASQKDEHHERVKAVYAEYRGQRLKDVWITTNHIVSETVTLSRRLGHRVAADLGNKLYSEALGRIHWATPAEEREAFQYFEKHADQLYSFTDCLSFVVMEKLGIHEALTVDGDFTHRFIARPGPIRR